VETCGCQQKEKFEIGNEHCPIDISSSDKGQSFITQHEENPPIASKAGNTEIIDLADKEDTNLQEAAGRDKQSNGGCYPQLLGITKEMMSRGPQVADMEYRETT
jgi:hypothetical protein